MESIKEITLEFSNEEQLQISQDILLHFDYFKAHLERWKIEDKIKLHEFKKDIFEEIINDLTIFIFKYQDYYKYFQFNSDSITKIKYNKIIYENEVERSNNLKIIKWCIKNNKQHLISDNALYYAVIFDNFKLVKLLLKKVDKEFNYKINENIYTLLPYTYKTNKKIYNLIINNGINNIDYYNDLAIALKKFDKEIIDFIMNHAIYSIKVYKLTIEQIFGYINNLLYQHGDANKYLRQVYGDILTKN